MRKPIIGGNWKMNTDVGEARTLAKALVQTIIDPDPVEVVICPPFTNLLPVQEILAPSPLMVGAQDVFWEMRGAFTGEISPSMLTSVGATYVIVGHSERRHILDESSEIVNRKARAAFASDLNVILAVGETEYERAQNETERVLNDQLERSLADIPSSVLDRLVIAYEPVWAIGTGLTATPDQAQDAHSFVRTWVETRYGSETAEAMRIQYGGSVNASNAAELFAKPDIDGGLIGGASLKPDEFASIVRAMQAAAA